MTLRSNSGVEQLRNPVWNALHTEHRHLAISNGDACRYPADVAPFAAVRTPSSEAGEQLCSLLTPDESVWLVEACPTSPNLVLQEVMDCIQMLLPEEAPVPETRAEIVPLFCMNAAEMVALTTLAFPGFFRYRTCVMGSYCGVRSSNGELVAMGGERLKVGPFHEISGVCTHPSFRGRGLGAALIWHVVRHHRANGIASWLHVGCANVRAVELYRRMGFEIVRTVTLHRVRRQVPMVACC